MTDLRRITRDEVPKEKRWQQDAVWELEFDRIKRWIAEEANASVGKPGTTLDGALQAGTSIPDEIRARFGTMSEAVDPTLMKQVALGALEQNAPSPSLISTFGFLRWVAMLCETLIFFWLWLMGFGNEVLIIMGIMLAGSGFLLGLGFGRLIVAHEFRSLSKELKGWASAIIGSVGIALISVMRAMGADAEGAFAIVATTVLLALLIAVFEALYSTLADRYRELHEKEFRCQVWRATTEHQRVYAEGLWKTMYEAQVRAIFHDHMNQPRPLTEPPPITDTKVTPLHRQQMP